MSFKRKSILLALVLSAVVFAGRGQGPPRAGYAVVAGDTGSSAPLAAALFSLRNSDNILISEAGVGGVQPIRWGRIFVDESDGRTGLAMANPFVEDVRLRLTLRTAEGKVASSPQETDLPAGQHQAHFVDEFFGELGSGFQGSLTFETVETNHPGVGAVTIRQSTNRRNEPLFATLPVATRQESSAAGAGGADPLVFPHIGAGSGLTTQLLLIDRSGTAVRGSIRLWQSTGEPLVATLGGSEGSDFPFQIAPDGVWAATLSSPAGLTSGYAEVRLQEGSSLPAGTAIFQFREAAQQGGRLISEAGVGAIRPTTRSRVFVDTVGTQTGVALANFSNPATTVTLQLLDRNNLPIASRQIPLPTGGHRASFVGELFAGLPPGFTGVLELTAPVPIVPITLKFTSNARGDPILTTLPVADLARPEDWDFWIIPQVGFGGGLETRLILISETDSEPLQGRLSFFDSAGQSLELPQTGEAGVIEFLLAPGGARQLRPGNGLSPAAIVFSEGSAAEEVVVNQDAQAVVRPLVLDAAGDFRDDFELSFAVLDTEVAQIDSLGRVQGLKRGFTTMTVAAGELLTSTTVTVTSVTEGAAAFDVMGLQADANGRLYLASREDHTISLTRDLTEPPEIYAGRSRQQGLQDDQRRSALFKEPTYLAFDQGRGLLYVSDTGNHSLRAVEPGPEGRVETLAGQGVAGDRDGDSSTALFNSPKGITLDDRGRLWVADSANHVIRRIDLTTGIVATVAGGKGQPGFVDGQGVDARFDSPSGIALETEPLAELVNRELAGEPPPPVRILVADSGNGAVRRVTESGEVTTVATVGAAAAGVSAKERAAGAVLAQPEDVAVDRVGNIFVSDAGSQQVMTVLRNGTTVPAAQMGTFSQPAGLVVAGNGRLVVADRDIVGRQIRYGAPEIEAVEPDRLNFEDDREVTIRGRNFSPESVVFVAGGIIENARVRDTSTITFKATPLPSGRVTLSVHNRGGLDQAVLVQEPAALEDLGPGEITTIVGGTTFTGDGSMASEASFSLPSSLALDSQGNLFVADRNNHRVRRIDALTGVITSVVGRGFFEGLGDGGPGLSASLFFPEGIAVGPDGALLIADTFHHRVRRVEPATGTITTIAGTGQRGFSGDGGAATEAQIDNPTGVAIDGAGNVYLSDAENDRVRRIDRTGTISTLAGTGLRGFSGDDGPASRSQLARPQGLTLDRDGGLLIADAANHRIRRVDPDTGNISTVAGNGVPAFGGDGGPANLASLQAPLGVDAPAGDLIIADFLNNRVREVQGTSGEISSLAGDGSFGFFGDGAPAVDAQLRGPYSAVRDGAGNLLIADTFNHRIRRVDADSNLIETLAGIDRAQALGDGGSATEATLSLPYAIAFDRQGDLLLVDTLNGRLRRVRNGQIVSLIDIPAGFSFGLAVDFLGDIFLSNVIGHVVDVILPTGQAFRVAGEPLLPGFGGDGGPAGLALLNRPEGLATDAQANLYIADRNNNRIRRVSSTTGIIQTVAGNGGFGFSGDTGPARQATLAWPTGVAVDALGRLFIADRMNHRVRMVDTTGTITTVAGTGEPGSSGDGGPATQARLDRPRSIALDEEGNLFIADEGNHRVRRIDASGTISTVAGGPGGFFGGDGGAATEAALFAPASLAFDPDGNLWIADLLNNRIRAVKGPLPR